MTKVENKKKSKATGPLVAYDEVITQDGIAIPFVPGIITPKIEKMLRKGRYEAGEAGFLAELLRPDDRVLDLGAGLGLVSTVASRVASRGHVTSVEANPELLDLVRETWRLNEVRNATLMNGVVTAEGAGKVPFYLRRDFWASSLEPDSRPWERRVEIPALSIADLVENVRPTVICCDIEGGELGLFDAVELSGVRVMVVEFHPKVYGPEGRARILARLRRAGFSPRPQKRPSSVMVLERADISALPDAATAWPPTDPRVLVVTCMKDEGPYILEWIAWQRALGVTDIVVFTNDCTDGTDLMLDRLQDMGLVTHLPNPALATGATEFQPIALAYAEHLRVFREADFVISCDVDEFLVVHVGQGRLADLFASVEPFDVLSVNEVNHGSNGRQEFAPGWVTELFPAHETLSPGKWLGHRGVKSIVRRGPALKRLRNHRPDLHGNKGVGQDGPVWLDGSGQRLSDFLEDPSANGCDCRGRYGLASLHHFALRSLDSYLLKMFRGDVVVAGRQVGQRYWRVRNRHEQTSPDLARAIALARKEYRMLADDETLMALHERACQAHAERARHLHSLPEYRARRDWILREAWEEPAEMGKDGQTDA